MFVIGVKSARKFPAAILAKATSVFSMPEIFSLQGVYSAARKPCFQKLTSL